MISYKPLFKTLKERDMLLRDLYEVIGHDTVTKFKKGHSMRLDTIEKVCIYLDVPIEDVVKITKD
ncbi:helix-turn-helix domain-containing protein [Alkalihalobacillus clausii]|nr:helix-turn-helix domain-containing protein [Shouchella clausii]MBU8597323.1 helix-turn-helix domain-containing protein [Shouchella clausii]